jgi:hypothetical protein
LNSALNFGLFRGGSALNIAAMNFKMTLKRRWAFAEVLQKALTEKWAEIPHSV